MKFFITGGAGFIGSNLADEVIQRGHKVTVYDSLVTGHESFIQHHFGSPNFQLVKADVLDVSLLEKSMEGHDVVVHFQANADVRGGIHNTRVDLEQNTIATYNVLDAMRKHNIKNILFSSSATVYGEPEVFPTPENIAPIQTSLYGASKYAAEAMIQAYCEYYGMRSWIFRFVSFIGKRYTHGVIFDFIKKLHHNPSTLHILGDGQQRKSYLNVSDGVNAMLTAFDKANDKTNIFNLGHHEYMNVVDLADILCAELGLQNVNYTFAGGSRGWLGDSPFVHLDVSKIKSLGWMPQKSIREGVIDTIQYLQENKYLFEYRD
ncbi:MAG: NAD-dependent epimerase/dehydratase family protein [Chitinophagales bacterium]